MRNTRGIEHKAHKIYDLFSWAILFLFCQNRRTDFAKSKVGGGKAIPSSLIGGETGFMRAGNQPI